MKIDSKELQDFIDATLNALKHGVREHAEFHIDGPISFSLAVVNKQEKGGAIRIYVTNASGKFNKEHISKLEFKISPKKPSQKRKVKIRKKRA